MVTDHELQQLDDMASVISVTRLPTMNIFGLPDNQCSTIELSVHASILDGGTWRMLLTCFNNRVMITGPHNSSLGIDNRFIGETLSSP